MFSFYSNYSIILGLSVSLRLIFLPTILVFHKVTAKSIENRKSKILKNAKTQKYGFWITILSKILLSLYIMTQFESFTYLATSIRVSPNIYDIIAILVNIGILISGQIYSIKIAKGTDVLNRAQFNLIKPQFIHLRQKSIDKHKGVNITQKGKFSNLPVIIVQNMAFTLKVLVVVVFSFIGGTVTYAYCIACIVICIFQVKIYHKNPYFEKEVVLYICSSVVEALETLLVLVLKLVPSLKANDTVSYTLIALMLAYISLELLAVAAYWVRVIFSKYRQKSARTQAKTLLSTKRENLSGISKNSKKSRKISGGKKSKTVSKNPKISKSKTTKSKMYLKLSHKLKSIAKSVSLKRNMKSSKKLVSKGSKLQMKFSADSSRTLKLNEKSNKINVKTKKLTSHKENFKRFFTSQETRSNKRISLGVRLK